MCEHIKERKDFTDIDIERHAFIPYEPYQKVPLCTDYKYGKKDQIVLRNKLTGQLERISYQHIGAVPFANKPGQYWYWGQIEATDSSKRNACLAIYFNGEGSLRSISASFCAPSPSLKKWHRMNSDVKYAAQITAKGTL